jgi:imidazolonepropionase
MPPPNLRASFSIGGAILFGIEIVTMNIIKNISYLAQCKLQGRQGEIHLIPDAALIWQDDAIHWVGPEADVSAGLAFEYEFDASNGLVLPGLIDCHTHLAFGGWRSDDFENRLLGKSYLEIAKQGGGIQSTVNETRKASKEQLLVKCRDFIEKMTRLGITTIECKSGYGLTVEDEIKLLEVYKELNKSGGKATLPANRYTHRRDAYTTIVSTFLGAHIVPKEYKDNRREYIRLLVEEMLPRISEQNLARFCDVFVEDTAYSVEEARQILSAAAEHGLRAKVHADQLSDCGGSLLAAEMNAVSADHLENITDHAIEAMQQQDVIGVLLPLASLYTMQKPADARRLIEKGVKVAVSTDFNPGSAPSYDLHLALMLACNLCGITPAEAVKGATIHAAQAVGMADRIGSLETGKQADFIVIDAPDVNHWLYHFRQNSCLLTVKNGRVIYQLQ